MLTHVPHEKHNRYSEAITVPFGSATMAFVAGQWGVTPGSAAAPTFEAETRACFANLENVLAKCGMGFGDVVRIDVFLSDLGHYDDFSRVRSEIFNAKAPTSTLVKADMLLGARVEITAIAIKASD